MSADPKKLPDEILSTEDLELVRDFLMHGAQLLCDAAGHYGFAITITRVPKLPLAMGNCEYECELSVSHAVYRSE